jgi:hypothetical protein
LVKTAFDFFPTRAISFHSCVVSDPVLEPFPHLASIFPELPEAPVFYPTVEEFKNPIEFIKSVRDKVAHFGICRIVPPAEWDRASFRRNIDPNTFRFPTKVQNVHQFLHRTGACEKFLKKLKKFWSRVEQQPLNSLPRVDGIEIDLHRLFNFVEEHGGVAQVRQRCHFQTFRPDFALCGRQYEFPTCIYSLLIGFQVPKSLHNRIGFAHFVASDLILS